MWLDDAEIDSHQSLPDTYWPEHKMYLAARYNMDTGFTTSTLSDSGLYGRHGTISGATYVTVSCCNMSIDGLVQKKT